jgi:outer membrane biosynthesis protein TonB
LPKILAVNSQGKMIAKAKVTVLEQVPLAEEDLKVTDELKKVGDAVARVASGVVAGSKIGGAIPIFPASAKASHTSGAVVMHALIGWDGHIHNLEAISYPSGDLAISALYAVSTWTYRPYVLNGDAVDVETTITVNYNIGP